MQYFRCLTYWTRGSGQFWGTAIFSVQRSTIRGSQHDSSGPTIVAMLSDMPTAHKSSLCLTHLVSMLISRRCSISSSTHTNIPKMIQHHKCFADVRMENALSEFQVGLYRSLISSHSLNTWHNLTMFSTYVTCALVQLRTIVCR